MEVSLARELRGCALIGGSGVRREGSQAASLVGKSEPKRMSEYDTPRNQDPGQYILGSQAKGGWEFWQVRWRTKAMEANLTFALVCLPSICGRISDCIRPR